MGTEQNRKLVKNGVRKGQRGERIEEPRCRSAPGQSEQLWAGPAHLRCSKEQCRDGLMDKLSLSTCFGERGRPFPAAVGSRGEGQLLVPRPFLAGPLEREQAPGQGLEAARVALCWGWPSDLWPGTFPSETHGLPAWEADRALVMGRKEARCGLLVDPRGAHETLWFPGDSDFS